MGVGGGRSGRRTMVAGGMADLLSGSLEVGLGGAGRGSCHGLRRHYLPLGGVIGVLLKLLGCAEREEEPLRERRKGRASPPFTTHCGKAERGETSASLTDVPFTQRMRTNVQITHTITYKLLCAASTITTSVHHHNIYGWGC